MTDVAVDPDDHLTWPRQTIVEYHVRVIGLHAPEALYTMLDENHGATLAECRRMYHAQYPGGYGTTKGVRARRVAVTYALPPVEDGAVRRQMVALSTEVIDDEHAVGRWP